MLKPGAEVDVNYIFDTANYKLSWKNDANGKPENAWLQEIDGFGNTCPVVFQNDEYIFDVDAEHLRIKPKNKTYTFYMEDSRGSTDTGESYSLTSIKVNNIGPTADIVNVIKPIYNFKAAE